MGLRVSAALAALLTSTAVPALAQESPPAQTAPAPGAPPAAAASGSSAGSPGGGLEEIVVTARKRTESAQNVPLSVTAFSPQQLQRSDLSSLEKVSAVTPSFTIARSPTGSGAQISLRGIGSDARSIGLEQSVAVIVDGVYYGQGRVINEGFFDLAGLEILKGPQALFFGKNATAGVVSLTTASPGPDKEFMIRAGYETNAQRPYGEAIASVPVTDTFGIRAAVRVSKMFGGYVTNRAPDIGFNTRDIATGVVTPHVAPSTTRDKMPGEKELLARLTAKWEPTDRLTLTLKGSLGYNHVDAPGWNTLIYYCPRGVSALDGRSPCGHDFVTYQNNLPEEIADSLRYADHGNKLYIDYWSRNLTGTINYELDDVTVTSVSNYNYTKLKFLLDGDYQAGPVQTFASERSTFRQISNETRIVTNFDGPINLLIGGYFQDTSRWFNQMVGTGNVENSAAPDGNRYTAYEKFSTTDGRTLSVYGQGTWKVVPNVELAAGVRYIHETKDSLYVQPYVHPNYLTAYALNKPLLGDQTFNNWSPDVTLTWHPTPDFTIYAAYKTAYKSGGFSNSTTQTVNANASEVVFQPEKARGFEAGIKGTILNRQLRFDLTAYDYKYDNLQVEFFNAATFAQISTNAGNARTTGVELQAEFAPYAVPGLNLRGAVNYNHARYVTFIAPCYAGQTPAMGCNTLFLGSPGQDLSGAPTSAAPRWTAALGVDYLTPDTGGARFGASIDTRYSAHYLASPLGNPFTRQNAYATLDATARVLLNGGSLEFAVIGKNLTNRYIFTGGGDAPSTGTGTGTPAGVLADQRGFIATPRTVQLQATARF